MEHTDSYIIAIKRLEQIHKNYARLLKLLKYKYELYQEKLNDLLVLEKYVKEKLRLDELSIVSKKLRIAKENCKIKMNRYKQEEM
jgi:hypothetical protein